VSDGHRIRGRPDEGACNHDSRDDDDTHMSASYWMETFRARTAEWRLNRAFISELTGFAPVQPQLSGEPFRLQLCLAGN